MEFHSEREGSGDSVHNSSSYCSGHEELLYINQLCLSGRSTSPCSASSQLLSRCRWEDLLKYLQPLKEFLQEFNRVEFVVRKQQYLEALTWQSTIDPPSGIVPWRPFRHLSEYTTSEKDEMKVDMELVVQTLKSLESLCSQRV
jgi:hypothetical protein